VRWGLIKASAGIAVAVVLVAGCSDKAPGTATPATTTGGSGETTSTTTGRSTPTSSGGAPKVSTPLSAGKYLPQPCTVLSAATLQTYKITKPGTPDVDSEVAKTAGPSCTWTSDDQPISKTYNVGFLTGNKNGLSDTYRGGKKAFPGYFEPTEVVGYPAVFNDLIDARNNGACNVTVGISDTLAFRAAVTFPTQAGATSCDSAKQLAAAVIETLKGA
jgi:hypothetical protein